MEQPLLPAATLRNLSDKLYDKRKAAALEVEQVTKQLALAGDLHSVRLLVNLLVEEYALSPQANHRKGGLIGLAAATVGLAAHHEAFLGAILPPVLRSFSDQDSRVRYYACEALYNIAKVSRGSIIPHFNEIFDALCQLSADADPSVQNAAHLLDRLVKDIVTESSTFSIGAFIPVLRERMSVLNPYVRQFLVGWLTVLDSVPTINMLEYLPDFLDGLLNMLSDPNREIRQQADNALAEFLLELKAAPAVDTGRLLKILVGRASSQDEFTRLTAIAWVYEFISMGSDRVRPFAASILEAALPSLSSPEERIRDMAQRTNNALLELGSSGRLDVAGVLAVAQQAISLGREPTRMAALRWVSLLLTRSRDEVLLLQSDLGPALLQCLSDSSDSVVLTALEVHAHMSQHDSHFSAFMEHVLDLFRESPALLEARGGLVVRRLCSLCGAERVYRRLASALEAEHDGRFAGVMVQALNLILLTAAECGELRSTLKQATRTRPAAALFSALYPSWCHSAAATVSLCLLAQAYEQAFSLVRALGDVDTDIELLVQVDQLVTLLESPVFTFLRLQLLEPAEHLPLVKTLYGLLALLPQTSAFATLQTRLRSVEALTMLQGEAERRRGVEPSDKDGAGAGRVLGADVDALAARFRSCQLSRMAGGAGGGAPAGAG